MSMAAGVTAGCGYYDSPGSDKPPPGGPADDAGPPPERDAGPGPVFDAGMPVDAPLPVDGAPAMDGGAGVACEGALEPDDTAATATVVSLEDMYINAAGTEGYFNEWLSSSLCSGDIDWYRVNASAFPFSPRDVRIRLLARDTGWCGASCQDVVLLPGPENTVFIELFDSNGDFLFEGDVSEIGDAGLYVGAPVGEGDFYLRIYGPAEAVYSYRLYIEISNVDGGDECEC